MELQGTRHVQLLQASGCRGQAPAGLSAASGSSEQSPWVKLSFSSVVHCCLSLSIGKPVLREFHMITAKEPQKLLQDTFISNPFFSHGLSLIFSSDSRSDMN